MEGVSFVRSTPFVIAHVGRARNLRTETFAALSLRERAAFKRLKYKQFKFRP